MTEAEWLTATDPNAMFGTGDVAPPRDWLPPWLSGVATDRKLRLYAVACCRHIEGFPWAGRYVRHGRWSVDPATDRLAVAAVLLAERYADALTTGAELDQANSAMSEAVADHQGDDRYEASFYATCRAGAVGALWASEHAILASLPWDDDDLMGLAWQRQARILSEGRHQAELLRDIFGNPFRPVTFLPEWRTTTVLALAEQMYDSRDFSAMPILVDALQDAGCGNVDVFAHCRALGPHMRGCWVVDACLGKS